MNRFATAKGGCYGNPSDEVRLRTEDYVRDRRVEYRGFRTVVRYTPERCFRGGGFASKPTGWWFGAPMTLDRVDLQATSFGFRVARRA